MGTKVRIHQALRTFSKLCSYGIITKLDLYQHQYGGESGIRTHVRVSPKHAFQACAFSHSAISPKKLPDCNGKKERSHTVAN